MFKQTSFVVYKYIHLRRFALWQTKSKLDQFKGNVKETVGNVADKQKN